MSMLAVRNLKYCYPDGTVALHDLSFTLSDGERLALIGPNGAGKSTLLLHLNGLLPEVPAAPAAVEVCGREVIASHFAEVRAAVGLLFQNPDDQLFCPTVAEDVAFGPQQLGFTDDECHQRVQQALAQVGLSGFADRHPHHLSHGEKHRVGLAGLLAMRARILALDEPSAGLDPRGRRELIRLLLALPQAQIIATHDLELVVEICHRALVIDAGRVVATGAPRALLADEALMLAHGLEVPHSLRPRRDNSS